MTSDPIKFLPGSLSDDETLYASSEAALQPVSHMQRSQPALRWRSTDTSKQQIWSTLSSEQAFSGMVLNSHNLTPDATVRLALYKRLTTQAIANVSQAGDVVTVTTTLPHNLQAGINYGASVYGATGSTNLNDRIFDITSTPTNTTFTVSESLVVTWASGGSVDFCERVIDETTPPFLPRYGLGLGSLGLVGLGGYALLDALIKTASLWHQSVTATHMLIELNDPNNPDGYIEVGRLLVIQAWSPDEGFDYGMQLGYQDDTRLKRSRSGSLHSNNMPSYRTFSCTFTWLNEFDGIEMNDLLGDTGRRKDVFISAFPDLDLPVASATNIYGRIVDYTPLTLVEEGYQIRLKIEENI